MNADPKCEALYGEERVYARDTLVSADGGLKNVFVYLKDLPDGVGPFSAPEEPARLVQNGCLYEPRVQGLLVNQKIDIVNDDPTLHNVRCLAKSNRPFNLGQPAKGTRQKFFTKPEKEIKLKCDVHPWMSTFVFVMEHPFFAVTDADGNFEISGLPAGRHTLVAWHESLGEVEIDVDTASSDAVELKFVKTP